MADKRGGKKMNAKLKKVEISIKQLERIANFYEFPLAVFFMPENKVLKGTRRGYWNKKFKKINALLMALDEEIKGVL